MMLCMTIRSILVDQVPIDYRIFETTEDREIYLKKLADRMAQKHIRKIAQSRDEPEFFLDHVQSKMNESA